MGLKREAEAVEALGKSIGYGHMMSLTSALWRKDMIKNGYPMSGVFVPTLPSNANNKDLYEKEIEKYDNIINEAL